MSTCLGCSADLAVGAVRSMCAKCRSYIGRWRKRNTGDVIKRQTDIALCARRLGIMKDVPKKGAIEVNDRERKGKPTGKIVSLAARRKQA